MKGVSNNEMGVSKLGGIFTKNEKMNELNENSMEWNDCGVPEVERKKTKEGPA